MSHHAYSRCWLHLAWTTHERERMLSPSAAARVSNFLTEYAAEKEIYLKINFVNTDHVHALIDLPTNLTIEDAAQLLKGGSSYWINDQKLVRGRFSWGRGCGAFSVSQSDVARVAKYIAGQEEHHRRKTFAEEYQRLVEVYGLAWRREKTVKTVSEIAADRNPSLKRGANENRQPYPSASASPANLSDTTDTTDTKYRASTRVVVARKARTGTARSITNLRRKIKYI